MAAGGLGLGLSLARELVELHGGTVQARTEGKNKGSIFTVRCPCMALYNRKKISNGLRCSERLLWVRQAPLDECVRGVTQ